MVRIFLPLIGQYHNIGDVILRRPLANWLRPMGQLHIYLGSAGPGYLAGLTLQPNDKIYRSFWSWYWAGLKAAIFGHAHYVFKPGEIQLTLIGMKEHVGLLPLIALIRLRGGRVIRVGAGARNFAALPRMMMWPSNSLSHLVYWRDALTARYLRKGAVMPDLAFCEGTYHDGEAESAVRDTVVVSMRGDRASLPVAWVEGISLVARKHGLRICFITQVTGDGERSREMSALINGEIVDWDGQRHDEQERVLRSIYSRTVVAISDRLHVLIAAYTEGAVPVAPESGSAGKIRRHFDALGLHDVAEAASSANAESIAEAIERRLSDRNKTMAALAGARAALDAIRLELAALLSSEVAARRGSRT